MASVRVAAAGSLELLPIEAAAGSGLDDALTKMRASNPDAVLILSIPAFIPDRRKIAEFMVTNQLPAIYPYPEFIEAGGLMCYTANFDDLFRRAADYVDKILRGASAGELPVQQATAFLLIVNLRVARALSLTIPGLILAGADEVIE